MISKKHLYSIFILLSFFNLGSIRGQEWAWLQTIRPGGNEYCWDIATDPTGNVLATGRVKGTSIFGSTPNTQTPSWKSNNETDVFLVKYRPNGSLAWVKRDGGKEADWGRGVATDHHGNVYVTGDYCDTAQFGAQQIIGLGASQNRNIFVAKYDSSGTCLWARTAGNTVATARGHEITVDTAGNVYITGSTNQQSTFDGALAGTNGKTQGFIAKYSASGNIIWVKTVTASTFSQGNGIKFSKNGALYITGDFKGTLTVNGTNYVGFGITYTDIFTCKMDINGNFIWAKVGTGNGDQIANGVDTDDYDNVYITGNFVNNCNFGTATIVANAIGATAYDMLIAKYDLNGTLKWVKNIGGAGPDPGYDICVHRNSNILVVGRLAGSGEMDTIPITNSIGTTMVACFDSTGVPLWHKLAGGNPSGPTGAGTNSGNGIAVDSNGNVFSGGTFSYNITIGSTTVDIPVQNGEDAYIAKLFPPINPVIAVNKKIICTNDTVSFTVSQDGSPLAYQWLFSGGTPAISSIANPSVTYTVSGIYDVQLIISNGFETDTTILQNYVYVGSPVTINMGNDTTICQGQMLMLDAGLGLTNYSWNIGGTNRTLTTSSAGQYFVTALNGCNLTLSDTIQIAINPLPVLDLGTDTIICQGTTVILDAGPGMNSYLWNNSSTDQIINVSAQGQYFVTITNSNSCSKSDSIQVMVKSIPVVNLGPDTTICQNETLLLDAGNPMSSYLWNNASTDQTLTISTQGQYWVAVSVATNCNANDTIQVIVDVCTDIVESFKGNKISIFPNPATDHVIITFTGPATQQQIYFQLFNFLGEIVTQPVLIKHNRLDFNTDNLEKGIYMYRINISEGEQIAGKLIIQ